MQKVQKATENIIFKNLYNTSDFGASKMYKTVDASSPFIGNKLKAHKPPLITAATKQP